MGNWTPKGRADKLVTEFNPDAIAGKNAVADGYDHYALLRNDDNTVHLYGVRADATKVAVGGLYFDPQRQGLEDAVSLMATALGVAASTIHERFKAAFFE